MTDLLYRGQRRTVNAWAAWATTTLGIDLHPATLRYRLHAGWSVHAALTTPVARHRLDLSITVFAQAVAAYLDKEKTA